MLIAGRTLIESYTQDHKKTRLKPWIKLFGQNLNWLAQSWGILSCEPRNFIESFLELAYSISFEIKLLFVVVLCRLPPMISFYCWVIHVTNGTWLFLCHRAGRSTSGIPIFRGLTSSHLDVLQHPVYEISRVVLLLFAFHCVEDAF